MRNLPTHHGVITYGVLSIMIDRSTRAAPQGVVLESRKLGCGLSLWDRA